MMLIEVSIRNPLEASELGDFIKFMNERRARESLADTRFVYERGVPSLITTRKTPD